ncbi:hypothetical protein [Nocardia sp. NPDC051463]|uniref:hypothetical protein n=1 Tax=Nocardia sp. NPDC051463 TaxID=3154845 RepID=UPI00343118F3
MPDRVDAIPCGVIVYFGSGPRKGIGDVFAVVETTSAIATIARRWRLRAVPGCIVGILAATTVAPRNLFLTLEKR